MPRTLSRRPQDPAFRAAFAQRLIVERKRLNLTQAALAEVGGIKRTSQALYENGSRVPDADYLMRVAAVGVDVMFLFTGKHARPIETTVSVKDSVTAYQALVLYEQRASGPLAPGERERAFEFLLEQLAKGNDIAAGLRATVAPHPSTPSPGNAPT